MSRFRISLSILATGLLALMVSNAQAQNEQTTTTTTIVPTTTTTVVPATTTTVMPATTTTMVPTSTSQVVVSRPVVFTTVPAPKETIVVPSGFANCFTVKSGWYRDIWIADHQVCQYANSPSGAAWVEGYWTCTQYNAGEGKCTNWDWKSAHWETTLMVY